MKTFFKILGVLVVLLIVGVIVLLVWFNSTYPKIGPAEEITVEITPERIARGDYLANHLAVCIDCHSDRDWRYYSGPIIPGTEGKGGVNFGEELALPGEIYTKNITPAGLRDWTDGEIIRAVVSGVSKNGNVLFPIMPYHNYNRMDREDLYSVIAYLKTLKPIDNIVPDSKIDFPLSLIVKTIPQPYNPMSIPNKNDKIKYGEYITMIASCEDCHTPQKDGVPIEGMRFAGGMEFTLPIGTVRSVNISPDPETGIGEWTEEMFLNRFKGYDPDSIALIPVGKDDFNTPMPWIMYAGMTEEDLGAIYAYIMSNKPVKNTVNRFSPPSKY